jgi:hypothetical protein
MHQLTRNGCSTWLSSLLENQEKFNAKFAAMQKSLSCAAAAIRELASRRLDASRIVCKAAAGGGVM